MRLPDPLELPLLALQARPTVRGLMPASWAPITQVNSWRARLGFLTVSTPMGYRSIRHKGGSYAFF
jgi:hypothetical protein